MSFHRMIGNEAHKATAEQEKGKTANDLAFMTLNERRS